MKKVLPVIIIMVVMVGVAIWLYNSEQGQSGYYGLPAVACVDPTLSIVQDFSLTVSIQVQDKNVPLDPNIGHDPGKCLRLIHTDDASGQVHIQSNDGESFTLGEFFQVWHRQVSNQNFMGNVLNDQHHLTIEVNGTPVSTFMDTPLNAGETIIVTYQ